MERTEIGSNICGLYIEDKATLKIRKKRDYIFNSFRTVAWKKINWITHFKKRCYNWTKDLII